MRYPGIYFAHLIRNDNGNDSLIFFVVRNDSSTSAILFQTSDESWQAYNGYGGHSLYGATGFDLTNRAYKVSYNRPLVSIETQTQPLYAEYPMVRWLEANGYDVSYFSSVDAAQSGALIRIIRSIFQSDTTNTSPVRSGRTLKQRATPA